MNFPRSDGSVPAELLPGFWRFLHDFWIGAPAVDANRSILYFGGVGVGTDILRIRRGRASELLAEATALAD
jgi:hypothetical protein